MSNAATAPAADYGTEMAAMSAYLEAGERRAQALGNRGPVRFTADGKLHPDILEAYWRVRLLHLRGRARRRRTGGHRGRIKDILDRCRRTWLAAGAKGRPALDADHQASTLFWSRPLGDPFGGTRPRQWPPPREDVRADAGGGCAEGGGAI